MLNAYTSQKQFKSLSILRKYLSNKLDIKDMMIAYVMLVILIFGMTNAYAHPLFNSQTFKTAGYKIQIATDPEIPGEGDKTIIMLAVTRSDDRDLNEVMLALNVWQGEEEILSFGPELVKNGHINIEHVFKRPGQYIAEVSIYENDKIIDARFNIGVTKTYSMIFASLIIISVSSPIVLLLIVKYIIPKKR